MPTIEEILSQVVATTAWIDSGFAIGHKVTPQRTMV
jgi:hypothetical protein